MYRAASGNLPPALPGLPQGHTGEGGAVTASFFPAANLVEGTIALKSSHLINLTSLWSIDGDDEVVVRAGAPSAISLFQ
jgi:hypothetical protein